MTERMNTGECIEMEGRMDKEERMAAGQQVEVEGRTETR